MYKGFKNYIGIMALLLIGVLGMGLIVLICLGIILLPIPNYVAIVIGGLLIPGVFNFLKKKEYYDKVDKLTAHFFEGSTFFSVSFALFLTAVTIIVMILIIEIIATT